MRLFALLVLLSLIVPATFLPAPAYANHGMVTLPDCSTYEMHLEDDYVKGRTDAMIYHVDHTVEIRPGCRDHAILSGVVPAGIGEAQGNAWQAIECPEFGREHAVGVFNYGFHQTINPDDVKVTCSAWRGHD